MNYLDMVQQGCYRYYWECGNPDSGMAVEVLPGDGEFGRLSRGVVRFLGSWGSS